MDEKGRTAEEMSKAKEAFIPFSVGPRACIGKRIALYELQVSVARVLWLFNIRIALRREKIGVRKNSGYRMKDYLIVGKEGPSLRFQKR